jgi:methylamine---glutamate N-methyltransferase subunit A
LNYFNDADSCRVSREIAAMCGIVGLFLKDKSLEPKLGELLSEMLVSLSDRGPDSAGIAIYGSGEKKKSKITIQSANPDSDFAGLGKALEKAIGAKAEVIVKSTHAVIEVPTDKVEAARDAILELRPSVRIMGVGEVIEIFKEVGLPGDVVKRFSLTKMAGTHGIGHTRMATESAVTTMGAHPFSTGPDQCLVHNGSLSNHNNVRRELKHEGMTFETENDTEVAGEDADRPRRLLHLRRRHQERLRRGARPDRLQTRRHGRDRPICRFRFRVPRARQPARHRGCQGVGA